MNTVLVFKTSVERERDIDQLRPVLDQLIDAGERWNFDLEDCDKILRVETQQVESWTITSVLAQKGFCCTELEWHKVEIGSTIHFYYFQRKNVMATILIISIVAFHGYAIFDAVRNFQHRQTGTIILLVFFPPIVGPMIYLALKRTQVDKKDFMEGKRRFWQYLQPAHSLQKCVIA